MTHRIILIGGAPTVGKSFLARKLGKELGLLVISTDTIREKMRASMSPDQAPTLFYFDALSRLGPLAAADYLSHHTPQEIVNHANQENEEVWKGVCAYIANEAADAAVIIEGMAVLPREAAELARADNRVHPVFLVDHDTERLRDVIYTRGLWDDAFRYPDSVKPRELEWVTLFNDWIVNECRTYNLTTIERTDDETYIAKARAAL